MLLEHLGDGDIQVRHCHLHPLGFDPILDDKVCDDVVDAIIKAAHTGKIGDGKIFVQNVEQVIRIRTGETGPEAV